jgi:aspartate/methionine/tyrosine aminotransferase
MAAGILVHMDMDYAYKIGIWIRYRYITQGNPEMAVSLALASQTTTSSLSAVFVGALLKSTDLPELIKANSTRLSEAYIALTDMLKRHNIPFIPVNAGIYLFTNIAPDATSWEDEMAAVQRFREAGILVSPGKGYHGPERQKGWARIGFAVEEKEMEEALERMDHALATCLEERRDGRILEPNVQWRKLFVIATRNLPSGIPRNNNRYAI